MSRAVRACASRAVSLGPGLLAVMGSPAWPECPGVPPPHTHQHQQLIPSLALVFPPCAEAASCSYRAGQCWAPADPALPTQVPGKASGVLGHQCSISHLASTTELIHHFLSCHDLCFCPCRDVWDTDSNNAATGGLPGPQPSTMGEHPQPSWRPCSDAGIALLAAHSTESPTRPQPPRSGRGNVQKKASCTDRLLTARGRKGLFWNKSHFLQPQPTESHP